MKIVVDTHAWIPLAELTHMQRSALKATLTVTPRAFPGYPGPPPAPIPLYVEKPDFIGIPRSYFMANRKEHHEIVDMTTTGRQDLWDGPFTFAGSLRPTQQEAIDKMSAAFGNGFGGGIIRATTGWGKCLHPDTPVLRFDGTLVPVRTIRAGDLLMGPDSTPRRVEAANAGHGPMYRITPTIGDPWECNDAHILTLVDTKTDAVRDIPLQDYLKLPPSWKHRLKQFSPPTGVDFPSAEALPLDPYFVGLWYGDGTKALNGVAVSKPDPEVLQTCHDIAAKFGLHVRTEAIDGKCPTHHLSGVAGKPNALLNMLRVIYGDGTALPHRYLTASRADRQSFLAGYLDSDGYHNNGCYEVVQKNKGFANGIAFTARSLGIRATVRLKEVNGAPYWRVKFAGDFYGLPLRIPRKKPRQRLQLKVATRTGFSVERLPDGDFFGMVLDGDHRYLLGDFTVTHNTVFACAAMARMNCPTLVIVHKEFLLNQWRDRIAQFLPGAKIGIVQQDRSEFKGYSVAIAMVHSLVGDRDYGEDFWDWPGLVITDECFPAGTTLAVGDGSKKPIEQFAIGHPILSAAGDDTVTDVIRRKVPSTRLRLLRLSDGSELVCTEEHPFLSLYSGWMPAKELAGMLVLTSAGGIDTLSSHGTETPDSSDLQNVPEAFLSSERASVLLSNLYRQGETANGLSSPMRVVWGGTHKEQTIEILREQLSLEILDAASSSKGSREFPASSGVASTSPECCDRSVYSDAIEQPDAFGSNPNEGVGDPSIDRAQTSRARREWSGADTPPADASQSVGERVGGRAGRSYQPASHQRGPSAEPLQAGPCAANGAPSGGDRWPESLFAAGAGARPEERQVAAFLRVDSVSLLQPDDFVRLGISVDPDTGCVDVFNISVKKHPSYVLQDSKLLVHNCHRTAAESWSRAHTRFRARWRLGVSATPRRKDGAEEVFLKQIGPVIFTSAEQRMKPKVRRVWTDFKLIQTPTLNPDVISKNVLLKFMCSNAARNKMIAEQIVLAVVAGRKPIVLSERLNHLDTLEAMFKQLWKTGQSTPVPTTGFYVGGMKEEELETAAEAQVIFATRQFAEEGLDIPMLDSIFLTTPFSDVEQAVGRILRPIDGKKDPIVVDIIDPKVNLCVKSATYRDRLYKTKGWE
jgi:superfamily II DNA or RNA helicase